MARLSQKQVKETIYTMLNQAGVPTDRTKKKNSKRGYFYVGGEYGLMNIQYVYAAGANKRITHNLTAREMWDWLDDFNPKKEFKRLAEEDKRLLESEKIRASWKKKRVLTSRTGKQKTVYPINAEETMGGGWDTSRNFEAAMKRVGNKRLYQLPNGTFAWRK